MALMAQLQPETDVFGRIFGSVFQMGNVTVLSALLEDHTSELSVLEAPLSVPAVNLEVSISVDPGVGPIGRMMINQSTHVDTILLRRSACANKYDGFRVPPLTDKRLTTSKVKPRKDPSLPGPSAAGTPNIRRHDKVSDTVPPPTSIHAIQPIGINMCGVHPSQLSPNKLLASQRGQKSDGGEPDAT